MKKKYVWLAFLISCSPSFVLARNAMEDVSAYVEVLEDKSVAKLEKTLYVQALTDLIFTGKTHKNSLSTKAPIEEFDYGFRQARVGEIEELKRALSVLSRFYHPSLSNIVSAALNGVSIQYSPTIDPSAIVAHREIAWELIKEGRKVLPSSVGTLDFKSGEHALLEVLRKHHPRISLPPLNKKVDSAQPIPPSGVIPPAPPPPPVSVAGSRNKIVATPEEIQEERKKMEEKKVQRELREKEAWEEAQKNLVASKDPITMAKEELQMLFNSEKEKSIQSSEDNTEKSKPILSHVAQLQINMIMDRQGLATKALTAMEAIRDFSLPTPLDESNLDAAVQTVKNSVGKLENRINSLKEARQLADHYEGLSVFMTALEDYLKKGEGILTPWKTQLRTLQGKKQEQDKINRANKETQEGERLKPKRIEYAQQTKEAAVTINKIVEETKGKLDKATPEQKITIYSEAVEDIINDVKTPKEWWEVKSDGTLNELYSPSSSAVSPYKEWIRSYRKDALRLYYSLAAEAGKAGESLGDPQKRVNNYQKAVDYLKGAKAIENNETGVWHVRLLDAEMNNLGASQADLGFFNTKLKHAKEELEKKSETASLYGNLRKTAATSASPDKKDTPPQAEHETPGRDFAKELETVEKSAAVQHVGDGSFTFDELNEVSKKYQELSVHFSRLKADAEHYKSLATKMSGFERNFKDITTRRLAVKNITAEQFENIAKALDTLSTDYTNIGAHTKSAEVLKLARETRDKGAKAPTKAIKKT